MLPQVSDQIFPLHDTTKPAGISSADVLARRWRWSGSSTSASANYLKRGYGRATFHSSVDVRAGLLSRDEAWELIRHNDGVRPEGLDYYLKITGMSEEEFYLTMEKHRRAELKKTVIPIYPKREPNEERLVPHPQQLIEKVMMATAPDTAGGSDEKSSPAVVPSADSDGLAR